MRDGAGVIARAAGDDLYSFGATEHFGGQRPERSFQQFAAGDALFQRLRDCARLLVNFLEHVVGVVALLRRIGRQRALLHGALRGVAVAVEDAHALAANFRDVAFLEEDELTRHRQQRRDVRRDEVLVVADADHDRATGARQHDRLGRILRQHGERVRAFELRNRGAHRAEQVAELLLVIVNAMRDHFGVGLRSERVAELGELLAQLLVVLDDAVVNDRDAVARDVRMRVALGGHAVRRPARVRDAEMAVDRRLVQRFLQHPDLADGAQAANLAAAIQDGKAGRVVTAVFEAAQAFDQDGNDVSISDRADDSAHE